MNGYKYKNGKEEFAHAGPMPDKWILWMNESGLYMCATVSYKKWADMASDLYFGEPTGYPEEEK